MILVVLFFVNKCWILILILRLLRWRQGVLSQLLLRNLLGNGNYTVLKTQVDVKKTLTPSIGYWLYRYDKKNELENADLCVDLAEILDLGAGLLCLLHQNHGGGDQRSLGKF
jgi:hypothetical protein